MRLENMFDEMRRLNRQKAHEAAAANASGRAAQWVPATLPLGISHNYTRSWVCCRTPRLRGQSTEASLGCGKPQPCLKKSEMSISSGRIVQARQPVLDDKAVQLTTGARPLREAC